MSGIEPPSDSDCDCGYADDVCRHGRHADEPSSDFLAALVAVIEAWGRGEITGYDVLDAADAYLTARGIPRDE